jgi:uncharacterized protein
MKKEKPFIHLFKTPAGHYIYDVNTNAIIKTSKPVYEFLQAGQKNCAGDEALLKSNNDDDFMNLIARMQEKGFLSSKRVQEIAHPEDDTLEYYLANKLKMVILQVTQQCNFRCEYCAYSGNYLNRGHSNLRMSFETAKKGIDFLIDNSRDTERVNVAFYGGEPLLEFELIKKCIHYTNEIAEGKTVEFNLTTNGTLFTKEILDFFEQQDVLITISLDGPQEVHDRNRRFAVSGCGTFEKIIEKLEFFKENYPDYFQRRIIFNTVVDGNSDFGCINQFFTNYDTIKDSITNIVNLSTNYVKSLKESSEEYIIETKYELFKLYLSKLNRLDKTYVSKLVMTEYTNLQKQIDQDRVRAKELPEKTHHGGPCVPGAQRLFVDVNGNFFPCERVSENSEVMRIGHVDTGFNIEKVRTLLNVGKITAESCKNCWAFRFCSLCAAMADDTKELSPDKKHSNCITVRNSLEQRFKNYCVLKEFGHDFKNDFGYIFMEG